MLKDVRETSDTRRQEQETVIKCLGNQLDDHSKLTENMRTTLDTKMRSEIELIRSQMGKDKENYSSNINRLKGEKENLENIMEGERLIAEHMSKDAHSIRTEMIHKQIFSEGVPLLEGAADIEKQLKNRKLRWLELENESDTIKSKIRGLLSDEGPELHAHTKHRGHNIYNHDSNKAKTQGQGKPSKNSRSPHQNIKMSPDFDRDRVSKKGTLDSEVVEILSEDPPHLGEDTFGRKGPAVDNSKSSIESETHLYAIYIYIYIIYIYIYIFIEGEEHKDKVQLMRYIQVKMIPN